MVRKCSTAVVSQVRDYRNACSGFTHNASKYLTSGFLQGLGGGMLATVFSIYIKTAGMSESIVGSVEASVAFAAAVIAIIGAPLVAALGYRALLIAAIATMVMSRFGQALLPNAIAMLGFALAIGLSDGFMRAINSAFLSHNSNKEERTHLFSTDFLVRIAAGFFGGLAGGFLPTILQNFTTELASYQWTIGVGTLILGAGILPMLRIRERTEDRKPVRHAYISSMRGFTKWNHVVRLVGPQMFIALGGGMVMPFIPLYLKHSLDANIAQIGMILGFSSIVTALGTFGTPVISRKLGLVRGAALMQGLSVPFLAAVPFAHTLPLAIGALWTRGALMNMAGPMFNQFSMEGLTNHEKPVVAGWMFFSLNMMWLVGNLVGGHLMQTSYALPYVFAVACYTAGASLTYIAWRKHQPAEHPQTAAVAEAA